MRELPAALLPLAAYRQFIIYELILKSNGKTQKLPLDPNTLRAFPQDSDWQKHSSYWTDAKTACAVASTCGPEYGVGFLFTESDPFFFVDIDGALQSDNTWSPTALDIYSQLDGAAIEVSQSGTGLHIIGSGAVPAHGCKNSAHGLELYHTSRFVALTGINAIGSAMVDCSAALPGIVNTYFPPGVAIEPAAWTDSPVPEWSGPDDDDELLQRILSARQSAAATLGGAASFTDLWANNVDALAAAYPDITGDQARAYDSSTADAALAQHLAFWTGKNCERIQRLMLQSALVREKWDREDYLYRTITRAVSLQRDVYSDGSNTDSAIAEQYGAPKLRASSPAQRQYAEDIRNRKLAECGDNRKHAEILAQRGTKATFWINNKDLPAAELVKILTPMETAAAQNFIDIAEMRDGYQYMTGEMQLEFFRGCVYVQDQHRIFTPTGALLKEGQFDATYGGYEFQLTSAGDKTSRKAWEVFTESQLIQFPKVKSTCFKPTKPPGGIIEDEGDKMVNIYIPVPTLRKVGDPSRFHDHLRRMMPVKQDREIILAYMAACVQYPGVKFEWAPVIQGTQGNGKTMLTRCVAAALGKRYRHYPKASDIDNKFNAWLFGKLLIGVEDIYVPGHRQEVIEAIKPMITGYDGQEIQGKGVDQRTADICANFFFNSNHKEAIRITRDDRRFCVFYTAQQSVDDNIRDGLTGEYFSAPGTGFYPWLESEGYAIVANYLATYDIPDELNPAGVCRRAPETSSTHKAIIQSLGSIEQEILEAVDEDRPGFADGWISSAALERLLDAHRKTREIPPNRRRELMNTLGYDWHPGLRDGRVNNATVTDSKKTRLYIRDGHIHANLSNPVEIARLYDAAQQPALNLTNGIANRG